MFMRIGTSSLKELTDLLQDLLATPEYMPVEKGPNTTKAAGDDRIVQIQKVVVKSALISAEMWSDFMSECNVGLARNWYEFQN